MPCCNCWWSRAIWWYINWVPGTFSTLSMLVSWITSHRLNCSIIKELILEFTVDWWQNIELKLMKFLHLSYYRFLLQKVLAAHGATKVSAYVTHAVFPKKSYEKFIHKNDGKEYSLLMSFCFTLSLELQNLCFCHVTC